MRRQTSIKFAKKPRNQEARRKEIIACLSTERYEASLVIKRTEPLIRYFETHLDTLNQQPRTLESNLIRAANSGAWRPVFELLGIECDGNDWRGAMCDFFTGRRPRECTPAPKDGPVKPPVLRDALAEAASIVSDARASSIDIDWTDEPKSDEERQLRLAIIQRIEREEHQEADEGRKGFLRELYTLGRLAGHIGDRLRELVASDDDEIGSDLYDAIAKWDRVWDDEYSKEKARQRIDLKKAALRDLERGDCAQS